MEDSHLLTLMLLLYIFWILAPNLRYHLQTSSPIQQVAFLFCWKFLLLCRSFLVWCSPIHLSFFSFAFLAFGVKFTKDLSETNVHKLVSMISAIYFIVSGLLFKSLTHLSSLLCLVSDSSLLLVFCTWLSSCPNTIYWRGFPFSIVYSWPLCQILVFHICVGLHICCRSEHSTYLETIPGATEPTKVSGSPWEKEGPTLGGEARFAW